MSVCCVVSLKRRSGALWPLLWAVFLLLLTNDLVIVAVAAVVVVVVVIVVDDVQFICYEDYVIIF